MSAPLQQMEIGAQLPCITMAAIDRDTLRRYADASGDHAPIHLDTAIAQANGFPDVIAHGLLVMGYLGRALGEWFPEWSVEEFTCRFQAVTQLGDRPSCTGRIAALLEENGTQRVVLELEVHNQSEELKLKGNATLERML
jgi:acyl dehydratase